MAVSIDRLQINIESESVSAVTAIEDLLSSLGKLQSFTLGNGIASSIRDIGNAAKSASKHVGKMGNAFASANKYAMVLKNFDWTFGKRQFMNNGEEVFNTRPLLEMSHTDIGFEDNIFDVPFTEVTPLLTTTKEIEEGFAGGQEAAYAFASALEDVDEVTRNFDNTVTAVWTNVNRLGSSMTEPERRVKAMEDAFAAFSNANMGAYNPSAYPMEAIGNAIDHFKTKLQDASKSLGTFFKSIQRIAMYRAIRTALKAITSGLTEGIQNLAQYSKAIGETDSMAANSVMSEYATKMLEVKNAVGAAVMPVLAALQPVIINVANAFITATNALNMFFAALGGSGTYTKAQTAAVDYAATLDKSSAGASKAAKELSAGFDELNVISDNSGGGGGGATANGMPDFKDMFSENIIPQWLLDNLQLIKDLVIAIGIGLLAWKIASMFTDDLSKIAGLAIAAAGAFLLVKGAIDAWNNGVDWQNLIEMIGGTLLLTAGLGIAFGAVGAAIGLLVGGVVMLVVGIKDWITAGELSTQTFWLLEAGIVAVGVGLAIFLGWIPLVVAAVIGIALAIYQYWDEIKLWTTQTWNNIVLFLSTVWIQIKTVAITAWNALATFFTGLWTSIRTVLETAWNGIKTFFGVIIPNIINSIVTFFGELPNKIKAKIDLVKNTIATWAKDAIGWVKTEVPKIINSITDWFSKLPDALVNVGKNMIKALWNGILSMGDWLMDKLTGFLGDLGEFAGEIFGSFGGGSEESYDAIPKYASGGIIDSNNGQLFLARENGAELVGSIGGSTAVMNNDQIVAAVSIGVYDAVVSAMSQTNGRSQSVQVFLDGKQIEASSRDTKQRRGATIASGGIYNFA